MFGPDDAKLHARLNAYRTLGSLDVAIDMLDAVLQTVGLDGTSTNYCPSMEKNLGIAWEKLDQALQLFRDARADLYRRTEAE